MVGFDDLSFRNGRFSGDVPSFSGGSIPYTAFDIYIIYIYIPGTQMTLVLIAKVIVLEGGSPKIEDKQVPGI